MVKRGEPELGTGTNHRSELDAAASPPSSKSASPALRASQGLAPIFRAATGLSKPFGHGAVPTFFWGGEATTAAHQGIGESLNQMGVWRDSESQPMSEEPGALPVDERRAVSTYRGKITRHPFALLIMAG